MFIKQHQTDAVLSSDEKTKSVLVYLIFGAARGLCFSNSGANYTIFLTKQVFPQKKQVLFGTLTFF